MCAAIARASAASVVLAFCMFGGRAAYPQESFRRNAIKTHTTLAGVESSSSRCALRPTYAPASSDAGFGKFTPVSELWVLDDLVSANDRDMACLTYHADGPAPVAAADLPCSPGDAMSPACRPSFVPSQADLSPLGKPGEKIAWAREEILSILSTPNVCSAWFEEKDPYPASTFRTISYEVDKHGQDHIVRSHFAHDLNVTKQPYAAKVTQDGGAYSMITINAQGAFYRARAFLQETDREDGILVRRGTGDLKVGSYVGGTLEAQMLTLLHEFGHVINLLPLDGDDMDGTSLQNTNLVLRNCQAEIEARTKPNGRVVRIR